MSASPAPVESHVVVDNVAIADGQRLVVVDGGAAAAAYATPAQVVEVEHEGRRTYVVIASPLDRKPHLELLVRQHSGTVTDKVAATPVGASMWMTRPFGAGFRLERASGRTLWMCVAGTGIAAVRPVLHDLAAAGPAALRGTQLFYGVRTSRSVAFAAELRAWAAQGLEVRICLSDEEPKSAWERRGWVQRVLAAERPDLSQAAILFAGPRAMGPALEAVATGAGMPPGMMLSNF